MTRDTYQAARHDGIAFVVSLVAVALVLAAFAGLPLGPVRVPVGLVVGLFAPGYLLLRASAGVRVRGVLRFVLPVPLTLALAAIVGVALDATPRGLRGDTAGLVLSVCALAFAAAAAVRGVHPVTLKLRDARPSLRGLLPRRRRPAVEPAGAGPAGFAVNLPLGAAALVALVLAGLAVERAVDESADGSDDVALTGLVRSAAVTRPGSVRARVELRVINHRAAALQSSLRVAVIRGRGVARQRVTVAPGASRTVPLIVELPCTGEIRAELTGPGSRHREVRLRVRCPSA